MRVTILRPPSLCLSGYAHGAQLPPWRTFPQTSGVETGVGLLVAFKGAVELSKGPTRGILRNIGCGSRELLGISSLMVIKGRRVGGELVEYGDGYSRKISSSTPSL
jgi:hypothetical protein